MSYTSLGHARMLNGALQMGTFTVCRSGQRALHVVLANSGRVRTERTGRRLSVMPDALAATMGCSALFR